jgi:acyl carrier protein
MTHEDILSSIYEELGKLQTDPRVSLSVQSAAQTTVESLNLDSLELLNLVFDLQNRLGVSLTVADFAQASTLAQVAEHISRLKEERSKGAR